jgi:hypothetical protein
MLVTAGTSVATRGTKHLPSIIHPLCSFSPFCPAASYTCESHAFDHSYATLAYGIANTQGPSPFDTL